MISGDDRPRSAISVCIKTSRYDINSRAEYNWGPSTISTPLNDREACDKLYVELIRFIHEVLGKERLI